MTTPLQGPVDVNVSRCTVRVKTTVWADKRGLHTKKKPDVLAPPVRRIPSRRRRRDRCKEVLPRILNLGEVEDGIYEVVVCNGGSRL